MVFRRVVDLTLTTFPSVPSKVTFPPLFGVWEDDSPEGPAMEKVYKSKCILDAFHLDKSAEELFVNIILGHNTPHTHVDIFMHDWDTMLGSLPADEKYTIRDVSLVPGAHFAGEAAVVDISDVDSEEVDLPTFQKRAEHVQEKDIVLVKTGHPQRIREGGKSATLPLITKEVAEWLVKEKRIRVWADDMRRLGSPNKGDWFTVEKVFYRNLITMVDELHDMSQVEPGRYFADCGLVLKTSGSEDSPARVKLFKGKGSLEGRKIIPLFDPINVSKNTEIPTVRQEPAELIEEIMKRYWVKGMHYSMEAFGMDRIGWVTYKSFTNRLGTHIQVPFDIRKDGTFKSWDLATVSEEKLCGRAAVVNLPTVGARQNVTVQDLERYGKHIEGGDIVVFGTNFTDNYYHRKDFMSYTPGFTKKALQWLVDKNLKMLISDTASFEENPWDKTANPSIEGRALLWKHDIPSVTCAANMWMLEKDKRTYIIVSPLPLSGLNASPVRVLAVEEYE